MRKSILAVLFLVALCLVFSLARAEENGLTPDKIKAIAVKAVEEKGIIVTGEVVIVYD